MTLSVYSKNAFLGKDKIIDFSLSKPWLYGFFKKRNNWFKKPIKLSPYPQIQTNMSVNSSWNNLVCKSLDTIRLLTFNSIQFFSIKLFSFSTRSVPKAKIHDFFILHWKYVKNYSIRLLEVK